VIPIPINLDSREFGFRVGRTRVKTFTDDEVKLLLENATERTQLYLLLMLNCGFTQGDVAELAIQQIDLRKKQIGHKRFKTEDENAVPVVVFPLWARTAELLEKHLNRKHDSAVNRHGDPLALVSSDGKPLLRKSYNAKGQLTKADAVRSAFNRVVRNLKNEGTTIEGTLKHLRKTSASKLETHDVFGRYTGYFLGHAPQSVANRHYVVPDQKQFNAAVTWLGEQFGY
jgi:integrase